MSIFSHILCNQFPNVKYPSINYSNIRFLNDSYSTQCNQHTSIQLIYNIAYLNNNPHYQNKFTVLNNIILESKTLAHTLKEYYFDKFSYSQRIYSILRKFSTKMKFKYVQKFEISTDLCFTLFRNLNSKIIIHVIEDNILYKFRISDIINIINRSLSNSYEFFAEPNSIKNPYTNLSFSVSNLYNIYFTIKRSNFNMPILLHQYFMTNFNLLTFKNTNECLIRDKAIDNFMTEATINDKYNYINKMFYVHYEYILFDIDPLFPKKKLVDAFEKYIKLFLLQEYSLNPHVRDISRLKLQSHLNIFSQLNPQFGKRIIGRRRRNNLNSNYSFRFNDSINDLSSNNRSYNTHTFPIINSDPMDSIIPFNEVSSPSADELHS